MTIGENIFTLEEGQTLNDLSNKDKTLLEQLKNIEGKVFKNFINKDNQEIVNEDTKLYENIILDIDYKDKDETIENPVTYDNIYKYIIIAIIMIASLFFGIKKYSEIK